MSDRSQDHRSRLDALEILVTHQERAIAELNDVITAHWGKIDALERQVAGLREELQNVVTQRHAPEPPPPHY